MFQIDLVSHWFLFAAIAFASTIQTATGFGGSIFFITLAALVYPIEQLIPIAVILNIYINGYLLFQHSIHIDRIFLLKQILPWTIPGLFIGWLFFSHANTPLLLDTFTVFIIIIASREIILVLRGQSKHGSLGLPIVYRSLYLFVGGIVHGIYASGGPLVVYVSSRQIKEKSSFRSTLAALWLILNILLILVYIFSDQIDSDTVIYSTIAIPILLVSIFLGEYIHKRLNQQKFRLVIYILLLICGIFILIK
jgi:hypothetical protein